MDRVLLDFIFQKKLCWLYTLKTAARNVDYIKNNVSTNTKSKVPTT